MYAYGTVLRTVHRTRGLLAWEVRPEVVRVYIPDQPALCLL